MAGCGEHDGRTAKDVALLLDLGEVSAVRWFLGARFQAVLI